MMTVGALIIHYKMQLLMLKKAVRSVDHFHKTLLRTGQLHP